MRFSYYPARRNEKAVWIVRPTWRADLLAVLSASLLVVGAIYADAYILHRRDITAGRFRHDIVLGVAVSTPVLCRYEDKILQGVSRPNQADALIGSRLDGRQFGSTGLTGTILEVLAVGCGRSC